MAESVEEALEEAIAEIESKELVKEVHHLSEYDKDLPGNWKEKLVAILHKVRGTDGYTWSHKKIYIKDESPYEYLFHYGGPKTEEGNETKKFFLSKLDTIKAAKNFDLVELESVNEDSESAVVYAIKDNGDKTATIYKAKCWKTGEDTFDYLLIYKEVVT